MCWNVKRHQYLQYFTFCIFGTPDPTRILHGPYLLLKVKIFAGRRRRRAQRAKFFATAFFTPISCTFCDYITVFTCGQSSIHQAC